MQLPLSFLFYPIPFLFSFPLSPLLPPCLSVSVIPPPLHSFSCSLSLSLSLFLHNASSRPYSSLCLRVAYIFCVSGAWAGRRTCFVRLSLQSAEKQTDQLVEERNMKIGQEVVEQRHMKIGQEVVEQRHMKIGQEVVEQRHMKIGQEVVEQRHMKIGQLMAVQKAHKDRPTSGRTEADEGQHNSHMPVLLCGMDFLTVCAILRQD